MSSGYPSGLTVSAFELLLRYFYTPEDPDGIFTGRANKALHELLDESLIENTDGGAGNFRLTDRGEVLARHIMDTPLPVKMWRMP